MRNLVRGEYFPQISNKVLSYYGELKCDLNDINDGDVVYCDTHAIIEFKDILNTKNDLIIITHNSDHYVCDGNPWNDMGISVDQFNGYKRWYCQNSYSQKNNVIPIPIGFENTRWESINNPKTEIIQKVFSEEINPDLLVYFNCNRETNINQRQSCFEFCKKTNFIDVDDPFLSYEDYLKRIKNHKFVISPRGNGLDCHRTWEILMMGRIPILKKEGQLERLYKNMPVLFVNEWEELLEIELESLYYEILHNGEEYLYFDFWANNVV